eukprot:jgi/Botrbrau1/18530/Bobra.0842s0002.1
MPEPPGVVTHRRHAGLMPTTTSHVMDDHVTCHGQPCHMSWTTTSHVMDNHITSPRGGDRNQEHILSVGKRGGGGTCQHGSSCDIQCLHHGTLLSSSFSMTLFRPPPSPPPPPVCLRAPTHTPGSPTHWRGALTWMAILHVTRHEPRERVGHRQTPAHMSQGCPRVPNNDGPHTPLTPWSAGHG